MNSEVETSRIRVREDLSPQIRGEVRCDPLTVAQYATDGSLYQIAPVAIVFPRDAGDVATVVKFASNERIPVFPRGAGTGIAGDSLGPGLIVDFSRFMKHVEAIDDHTVRVQPGMVYSQLNRLLRPYGRYFPPDPANSTVTTIGSMLALDAAGSHSVRVGSTRDHVADLEIVLANGLQMRVSREPLPEALELIGTGESGRRFQFQTPAQLANLSPRERLMTGLAEIIDANQDLITKYQPPLLRNRCGYYLRGILAGRAIEAARFLVGSEGTLALFTSATLHTMPLPEHRGVVLLLFPNLETAARTVQELMPHDPTACDLIDRRVLSLARDADERYRRLIPVTAESALLVEQSGYSEPEVARRLQLVVRTAQQTGGDEVLAHIATAPDDVDFIWALPGAVVPLLARLPGNVRPLPFVEDLAVPPQTLNDFLVRAQGVFRKHRVIASLYAHAATGQVHLRPFLPPPTPETAQQLDDIARDLYQVVFEVGGTISGEHGVGLSRSAYVRDQYGPLYEVFRDIKQLFDPHGILNPGKVINDNPALITQNLRPVPSASLETFELHLKWKGDDVFEAASRCNGCGQCRTREPESRMCPMFHNNPMEESTPRAKANLMRQVLTGELPGDAIKTLPFKEIADLCFNCKQCVAECPSNVDIPHLVTEAKAAYVVEEGLSRTDWVLTRAHHLGVIGSAASVGFNWALENPAIRWMIEKLTGISRLRKLPSFARRSFLKLAQRELLSRPGMREGSRPVVYFVDHFANYHDPELGRALIAILKHHRIPVYVPPAQTASGLALISAGDLEGARELALKNLRELADFAREGCQIICTEPSAALCLKQEYPLLVDHADVEIVARQTIEAGAYLAGLHSRQLLRTDFSPLNLTVGYHTPCHLRSLGAGTPLADLLDLIPGLEVLRMEHGCSGMAGAWGLSQKNFTQSIRIGWGLISRMRQPDLVAGTTECSGCKMQMEQGTSTPTIHPLKLLAFAYGLMPEIKQRLRPSRKRLLVT